jgi:hypothetical protein
MASLSITVTNVVLVTLVPDNDIVDKATNQSIDQESDADQAGDEDDRDVGALFNANAQDGTGGREGTQMVDVVVGCWSQNMM